MKKNTLLPVMLVGTAVLVVILSFFGFRTKQSFSEGDREGYVFLAKRNLQKGDKLTDTDLELKIVGESKIPQMAIWNPEMATMNRVVVPAKKGEILDATVFGLDLKAEKDLGISKWKILNSEDIASFLRKQNH